MVPRHFRPRRGVAPVAEISSQLLRIVAVAGVEIDVAAPKKSIMARSLAKCRANAELLGPVLDLRDPLGLVLAVTLRADFDPFSSHFRRQILDNDAVLGALRQE